MDGPLFARPNLPTCAKKSFHLAAGVFFDNHLKITRLRYLFCHRYVFSIYSTYSYHLCYRCLFNSLYYYDVHGRKQLERSRQNTLTEGNSS